MKGHRQSNGKFLLCQAVDFIHKTAGGKGNMPIAYIHALFMVYVLQKAHNIVIIVKGLAYAH